MGQFWPAPPGPLIQHGDLTVKANGSNYSVTFPRPFPTVPQVFTAVPQGAVDAFRMVLITARSTTGFTVNVLNWNAQTSTTDVTMGWLAVA